MTSWSLQDLSTTSVADSENARTQVWFPSSGCWNLARPVSLHRCLKKQKQNPVLARKVWQAIFPQKSTKFMYEEQIKLHENGQIDVGLQNSNLLAAMFRCFCCWTTRFCAWETVTSLCDVTATKDVVATAARILFATSNFPARSNFIHSLSVPQFNLTLLSEGKDIFLNLFTTTHNKYPFAASQQLLNLNPVETSCFKHPDTIRNRFR